MRVLLASTSGAGHFGPLVPFAHALRRAGHEILVAAPISAQPRVERAGLPSICFADPLERDLAPVWERVRAAAPDEANRLVLGELFGRVRARAALPGVELAIDAWRPDVVVRESCEFASAVAAEAREIPVARVGAFLQTLEELRDPDGGAGRRRAAPVGRPASDPAGTRLAASPYLTLTPASFELPDGPEPPRTWRFHDARAAAAGGAAAGDAAARVPELRLGGGDDRLLPRPLPRRHRRARRPADPAARDGRRGRRPGRARPLPAHVRVERWIPQAEVFTEADAMVGHGGFGTTVGALLAGVPQVVVPLFADQPYNAQRIAGLGAGLTAGSEDPASVRAAVERVLAEPAFRFAAGRVALEAQGLPSIDAAPAALEGLVSAVELRSVV